MTTSSRFLANQRVGGQKILIFFSIFLFLEGNEENCTEEKNPSVPSTYLLSTSGEEETTRDSFIFVFFFLQKKETCSKHVLKLPQEPRYTRRCM